MSRSWSVLFGLLLVLASGACSARYQELLRTRDAEIRDLNAQLADLRATNSDLERREGDATAALAGARREHAAALAANASKKNDSALERVQNDLPDLDVRYRRGRLSIGIDSTVTFDAGSTRVGTGGGKTLRKVAGVLRREYPGNRIYIEGHTDVDPIEKTKKLYRSNRHLSAERADRVADYLVRSCGMREAHIVVVGYGPHDPRAPGRSQAAKAKNRRVEIVVGETM